jgi:hypothetical protein
MILHKEDRLTFLIDQHRVPTRKFRYEPWMKTLKEETFAKMYRHGGGDIAMHKLAYKLAERNHRVVMFCEPMWYHENIISFKSMLHMNSGDGKGMTWFLPEMMQFPLDSTVSVYSNNQPNNHFNTDYNAIWMLTDDYDHSNWKNTKTEDVFFSYSTWKTKKETIPLKAIHYSFDELYKTNNGRRKGFCHFPHKYTPENYDSIIKSFDSDNIYDWKWSGGIDYLREILNEYEYLITFDKHTAMTYLPGLCGCKTIILNTDDDSWPVDDDEWKKLTPEEYRLKHPHRKYGCAFGIEDIEWANRTIDLVPDHLKEMEKEDDKTVDNFIRFWKEKTGH